MGHLEEGRCSRYGPDACRWSLPRGAGATEDAVQGVEGLRGAALRNQASWAELPACWAAPAEEQVEVT